VLSCCAALCCAVLPQPPNPQVDEGLKSLDMAMNCGFEDYSKVRNDKNLAQLRTSPKFEKLINSYDEPVINWDAINNTFGAFGKIFNKK
jgi:hypothetical protein